MLAKTLLALCIFNYTKKNSMQKHGPHVIKNALQQALEEHMKKQNNSN